MHRRPLALLTFDIDDTLYSTTEFARLARENALRAMLQSGLKAPFERAAAELAEVIQEFGSNDQHHFDRLLQRLPPETCAGCHPAVLVAAGVTAYHRTVHDQLKLCDDVLDALRGLRAAGFRLGVLSQGLTAKQAQKLVRLGVLPFLDPRAIFFNELVGYSKNNPKFYLHVAQKLALQPERCLHAGDRLDRDVEPARRAGWLAALICRAGPVPPGDTQPTYRVRDFRELAEQVARDFAPVPEGASAG
jgi:putative hydrolase of the HAD superfamily